MSYDVHLWLALYDHMSNNIIIVHVSRLMLKDIYDSIFCMNYIFCFNSRVMLWYIIMIMTSIGMRHIKYEYIEVASFI